MQSNPRLSGAALVACLLAASVPPVALAQSVEVWLTAPSGNARFQRQEQRPEFAKPSNRPSIRVTPARAFQTMDGFGYTLTGGSAKHLSAMSAPARAALLRELFAYNSTNIGVSYLRVSIGASDLDERPFSYADLGPGETDPRLERFNLAPDRECLIPMLKEILAVNPRILILGSPWSPPAWMKDNQDTRGGKLRPEFYEAYAQYFVKYVQGMAEAGIPIDAVTVQNEPLHPGNNPSLYMPAPDQGRFVRDHLGPAFTKNRLKTKIIIYDHNADRPDYPISILNDPEARKFIDGSAFHLYKGEISALSSVHEAHPDKHLYFTEQWIGAPGNLAGDLKWHIKHLIVGASRNWARTVLEWNLSSNPELKPHTDRGGCDRCLGAVTLDGDKVTRNPGYFVIAHAAKFVRPGSERIDSSELPGVPNVAFKTPDRKLVLIALNEGNNPQQIQIELGGKAVPIQLEPGAVATCVWSAK